MSFILEGLYLGGIDEACDTEKLRKAGVTHILTLDMAPLPSKYHEGFFYKHVHALDESTCDLLSKLKDCLLFVEEGRQAGGVLVHCFVGQSRSATVVLAYIMQKLQMGLTDARDMVACQRPLIHPNPGFMEQLELFELMGNTVDTSHQAYKQLRLANLARQIGQVSVLERTLTGKLMDDPSATLVQGETHYRCRKCRRALFKQSSVLTHPEGIGEQAFSWHGKSVQATDARSCARSLFIEPVQWMEEDVVNIAGKLACPKCHSKLGSFIWSGERCSCGTWVTPAFQVQKGKVDLSRHVVAAQGTSRH